VNAESRCSHGGRQYELTFDCSVVPQWLVPELDRMIDRATSISLTEFRAACPSVDLWASGRGYAARSSEGLILSEDWHVRTGSIGSRPSTAGAPTSPPRSVRWPSRWHGKEDMVATYRLMFQARCYDTFDVEADTLADALEIVEHCDSSDPRVTDPGHAGARRA